MSLSVKNVAKSLKSLLSHIPKYPPLGARSAVRKRLLRKFLPVLSEEAIPQTAQQAAPLSAEVYKRGGLPLKFSTPLFPPCILSTHSEINPIHLCKVKPVNVAFRPFPSTSSKVTSWSDLQKLNNPPFEAFVLSPESFKFRVFFPVLGL